MSNARSGTSAWLAPLEIDPQGSHQQTSDDGPAAIFPEARAGLGGAADQGKGRAEKTRRAAFGAFAQNWGAQNWGGRVLALWSQASWTVPAFLSAIAALVVVALAFDAADLLGRSFGTSYALGVLVTLLIAMTVGTALKLALDEMLSIRRLRRIDALRAEAGVLANGVGHGSAAGFVDALTEFYGERADLIPALENLHRSVHDAHSDGEVITLIDRQIMSGLDQRAYRSVLKASRDTAMATALSPSAALDVAIVLWRNLKLVREVAMLYGARPGQLGSWRLMRRMLANLAVAGVADGVSHVAVDALGGSLAAAISTRLGQGMINGLLTARIGIAAMTLCRPLAFSAETKPSLRRVRTELMSVPKEVL